MYTVKVLSSEDFDKLPIKHAKEALGAADAKKGIAWVRDTGHNDVTKHTIEHELDELMQSESPHEIDGIRYKIPVGQIFSSLTSGLGKAATGIGRGALGAAKFAGQGLGKIGQGVGGLFSGGGADALGSFGRLGDLGGALGKGASNAFSAFGSGAKALGRGAKGLVAGGGADKAGSFGRLGDLGGGIKNIFAGGGADNAGSFGKIGDLFGHGKSGLTGSAAKSAAGAGGPTPISASTATVPGVGSNIPFESVASGGFAPQATAAAPSAFSGLLKKAGSGLAQGLFGSAAAGAAGSGSSSATGTDTTGNGGSFLDNAFGSAGKAVGAGSVGLLGDVLAPDPGNLDVSGITDSLRDRISGDSVSPLFQAGQRELLQDLDNPTEAPPEEAFARGDSIIREDLADQVEQLRNQFKQLNPNANVENNSAFLQEKSRLEERARERRAQMRDEQSFAFVREQLSRDLTEIQTALNVDSSQTGQLIQLAQLDAEALSINYGMDVKDAQDFKDLFGRFGQLLNQDDNTPTAPSGNTTNINIGGTS